MSLEQQLRETMRRVADGVRPDAARAYDRFLRRRRRRMIAMPAVAATLLVLLLATTVALAQRLPDPVEPVHPAPTPTPAQPTPAPGEDMSPQPLDYQPGPRTFEVPAAGFSIEVPEGWLVADEIGRKPFGSSHQVHLRPESEPRAEIQIAVGAVKSELGPGKGEVYPANTHIDGAYPSGPYTYSRRPDGRRVLEADTGPVATDYYIAWPYHCTPDVECRVYTKMRTLHVRFFAPEAIWPEVRAVGEAIVRDARPITNALPGGDDSVQRRPCEGSFQPPRFSGPGEPDEVTLEAWWGSLTACRMGEASLVMVSDGQPVEMEGDQTITLEGVLPEGGADPDGHHMVTWRWTNWCGPDVQVWLQLDGEDLFALPFGPPDSATTSTTRSEDQFWLAPPRCVDESRPSQVEVVATEP